MVDDSAVRAGICRFLSDVHGHCQEVFGKDPLVARAYGTHIQDLQPEGVSHHRVYDFSGHLSQIHTGHSGTVLRLVLSGTWPRTFVGRYPVPDPLEEIIEAIRIG